MQLCVEEMNQSHGQTAGLDRDLLMFFLDCSDWLCIQLAQFVYTDRHFRGRARRWSVVGVFKNHQIESIGSWMNKCREIAKYTGFHVHSKFEPSGILVTCRLKISTPHRMMHLVTGPAIPSDLSHLNIRGQRFSKRFFQFAS